MKNEIVLDDDSASVVVEMPKSERKRVTTVLSNWEFSSWSEEIGQFKLFLCANETYVRNIIAKKEEMPIVKKYMNKMPQGTIVYEEFGVFLKFPDGVEDKMTQLCGQFILSHQPYKGIKLFIGFQHFEPQFTDYFVARWRITQNDQKTTRTMKMQKEEKNQRWTCCIEESEIDKFLNKNLAVQVELDRQKQPEERFVGIRNDGNTCYMNSILQILFFMRPLRKTVVEYQGQGKVMLALKDVFLSLMDGPLSRSGPVDAQQLIQAYGRFSDYPRRQQDTQQFLLGFLEQLQGQCPSLSQLWQGQQIQLLQSRQEDKPYNSRVKEDFNGLDLPLQDFKGNTFGQIFDSLKYLLEVEHVQDKIQSDDFGKVAVKKSRQFVTLPPVLFLTLKRYQFKKSQIRPTKVMADLHYPHEIDLDFFFGTPTDREMEYTLFAVVVHRGQHYSSGHYYSYVNTSQDIDNPLWVKFDDSRIQLASKDQTLNFTGGKKKNISWSSQFQRYMENEYTAQDTAYVLVYYKKSMFNQYQKMPTTIPKEWFSKRKLKKPQHQMRNESSSYQVEVLVIDPKTDASLLWQSSTIPVSLDPDKDVVTQLKNLNTSFLGCKVGSVWKVSKQGQVIRKIIEFSDLVQSPSRIFQPKRGHRQVDYLLILPESSSRLRSTDMIIQDSQGLVMVQHFTQQGPVFELRLIEKNGLENLIVQLEISLHKKADINTELQESFQYGWNDYMQILFE